MNEHVQRPLVARSRSVQLQQTRPLYRLQNVGQSASLPIVLAPQELNVLCPLGQADNQLPRLHQLRVKRLDEEVRHTITRRREPEVKGVDALLHTSLIHLQMLTQLVHIPSAISEELLLCLTGDPLPLAHLKAQRRVATLNVDVVVVCHRQGTADLPGKRLKPNTAHDAQPSNITINRLDVLT